MKGDLFDRMLIWSMGLMAALPIVVVGMVAYQANYRELEPLRTYHLTCNNGSATVRATGHGRYKEGPRFYDVNGKRNASQSFPPDCFVTVEP